MSFIRIIIVLVLALGLSACGASKVPNSTLSSRGGAPGSSGSFAECNSFNSSSPALAGSIATYYNPSSGQYIPDQIQMILTKVPNGLTSNNEHHIQIFRWMINESRQRSVNTLPVRMYFIQRGTGSLSTPRPVEKISAAVIDDIISNRNLEAFGINKDNFFENHIIILANMDTQYDAISVSYYDTGSSNDAIFVQDVLLPPYLADPNKYISNNNVSNLYLLHPLYSIRNSGSSEAEYFQRTEELCAGFFSAYSRVPSSVDSASSSPVRQLLYNIKALLLKVSALFSNLLK